MAVGAKLGKNRRLQAARRRVNDANVNVSCEDNVVSDRERVHGVKDR